MTASTPLIIVTAVVIVLALTLLFLVNQPLRKRVGSFFGFSIENDYLLHIKTDEELAVLKKKQEQDTKKQFTRTQRIAKNGLWSFIQMFTTSLLSFIVRTMAIYYFTSQIFGISSTLGSYITIVNMIEFGITGSFTYRLSKAYHDKDIEKATIITQAIRRFNFVFFLIALGLGIILSFLLPVLIYEWNQDSLPISQTGIYILFFILLIPKILHFLTNNNHLLIYIDEKSRVVARYSIVIGVICHLLQIASFFIFKDAPIESQLYIYFGLMMVMTISTYIVSFWYSRKHYKVYYQHTKAKLSEKESRFLQRDISTSFTNKAFKMLHDFFVTFCRSTLVLSLVIGAFDTYSYIITLIYGIFMAGISQISVTFNNLYHTSTKEVVQHRFAGLSTLSLIIFSVLVVSTYGLTEGFINDIQFLIMGGTKETILLSSDPIRQNIFLFIFCFQTLSPIFLLPVTYVDDASGLSRKKVWVSLVSLIAMIILFYCFLDPFKNIDLDSGIFMLSVIVILLVQVFNYIIGIQYIFKYVFKTSAKTHYKKVLFCLIPMIISAIGAVTIVYLVDRFFPVFSGSEIIAFFIKGLTIFSLSVAVHILILRKTAEFAFVKNTIQGIFKRFFKRKSKAKKTNPN